MEEKREEIQNIIRKRQRKAALHNMVKIQDDSGKPTMAGFIGHATKASNGLLPDINTPHHQKVVNTETDEMDNETGEGKTKIVVKKLSESDVALSDRALAGLIDPTDKEEQRIEKLQQEVNEKFRGDQPPKVAANLLNRQRNT